MSEIVVVAALLIGLLLIFGRYRAFLRRDRLRKFAIAAHQCAKEINQLLNASYLKHSSWVKARTLAQETLNQFCWEMEVDYLDLTTDADFIQLKQIAQWNDPDIENNHRLARVPSQCLENIKTILNTDAGYLRLDSWRKAKDLAQETLNRLYREPAMRYLDISTEANFIQLKQVAQWSDQDIEIIQRLARVPSQCLENIKTILNTDAGYLRLDSWRKAKDLAQETLNRFCHESVMGYLDLSTEANFIQLKQVARWSDQDIEKFHRLATAVNQSIEDIKTILNAGYLRNSHWKRIKYQAKKTLNQSNPLENFLKRIHHTNFVLLNQIAELRRIAQWSKRDVEEFRQQYVDRCKKKFSIYFDREESKLLTERQRDACIIDEDNNLVLAGAGTGKTSTMVGRAGFLIHSGQAKPDQILMLTFANKAAREMQERLDRRVKEEGKEIVASTFHKLGRDIIVKVEGEHLSLSPLSQDEALLRKRVEQWFEKEMRENPSYKQFVLNYFKDYLYTAVNPFDFETEGEYLEHISANETRTLKGEEVKSLGECLIANHLLSLGVEYHALLLSSSIKRWEMVRLPLPMVMVGVLVALAAKVMLVRPPPGILDLTEAMSSVLELENRGDRETLRLLGEFAMNICPLFAEAEFIQSQESWRRKVPPPLAVRMALLPRAVEEPLKIQRVSLVGLSWLG